MTRKLIHCDTIADYRGILASPGAVLLDGHNVVAAGSPEEIGATDLQPTRVRGMVIPPFANVHSHLDLSGVGIQPPEDSFVSWVEHTITPIRKMSSKEEVHAATDRGIEFALAGGTAMVGDIASTVAVAKQVHASVLRGVSFVEVFGLGSRETAAMDAIDSIPSPFGVSPHAPYSCGLDVFRKAFGTGKPVATHLAELPEEFEATMQGEGPLVAFSKKVGAWNDKVKKWNSHPIDALVTNLEHRKLITAHVNYIEDHHLEQLAKTNITVAFCPRASAYFGHTNHRYEEMHARGVSVALGTDSLICLDTPERISVVDEMRFLYKQGCRDASLLLRMATVNGAEALDEDPTLLTLEEGCVAGLLLLGSEGEATFDQAMQSTAPPTWILPLLSKKQVF
ncbi:MAG: amidohydrolase family protein [Planctomycetes bacterium]|nr:amidohydrolase family protein [Planctomycetota bacterium]